MAFVALALISWIVSSALAPDSALPCNFLYGGILALANIQGEMDYNFYPMYGEKYGPFGKGDSAFFFESVGWIEKSDEDFQLVLVEGLFALWYDWLYEQLDLKVFIDCQADERIVRRLRRNMAERGLSFEEIAGVYLDMVRYRHQQYIEPTKWRAT